MIVVPKATTDHPNASRVTATSMERREKCASRKMVNVLAKQGSEAFSVKLALQDTRMSLLDAMVRL